jgi:hypothetical protein
VEGGNASTAAENNEIIAWQNKMQRQLAEAVLKAMDSANIQKAAPDDPIAAADRARKAFEEKQNSIDYKAEHERNLARIRQVREFSPDWLRSNEPLYVRGTVSRVELPTGRQRWARLYFNESPDGDFVACVYAPLFDNLQEYVGRRLELRGKVGQDNCGAKVADALVGNPAMVYDLAKGVPSDEAILPGMKVTTPEEARAARAAATGPTRPMPTSRAMPGAAPAATPASAIDSIPAGTQLLVSLNDGVDLLQASDGETLQGQLATPAIFPRGSGAIPEGSPVVLKF